MHPKPIDQRKQKNTAPYKTKPYISLIYTIYYTFNQNKGLSKRDAD